MADPDRIAAALRYQQELDAAQRPATMNPNLAAQGEAYRANMTPPTSVMDPRYPAWKKNQDAADAVGAVGDLALSAIPMAGPALQGVKAAGRFAGPELARGLENYMVKTGGILPMDTWHGTPHRFSPTAKNPLGEFDVSKIGTGEGAQAYGHGLYLAENPKVAKEYVSAGLDEAGFKKHFSAIVPKLDEIMSPIDPLWKHRSVESKTDSLWKAFSANEYGAMDLLDGMSKNEAMAARIVAKENRPFSMYKVDLPNEQIAKMLDWDKPLSQQPQLKQAIDKFTQEYGLVKPTPNMTGKEYYQALENYTGATSAEGVKRNVSQDVSGLLKQYGIPGIRYLDQGSRAGGSGTSNFVVFDPAHMNIIGRE